MFLLDTNILSLFDPRRAASNAAFIAWAERRGADLYLSVVTIFEVRADILKVERRGEEKRARELNLFLASVRGLYGDRILAFDADVAEAAARLQDRVRSRTVEMADLIIAATAEVHGMTVLTRNLRHFEPTGVGVIDPTIELPPDR